MVDYRIIATGSQGNAVIVDDCILIDCGVPFKSIKPYVRDLRLVLLTHIHGDHFKASTIKALAAQRPTLRFAACRWLVKPLVDCGVSPYQIDVCEIGKAYYYGGVIERIEPVMLSHDVPNAGWKIELSKVRVFYATDTCNLNGIFAPGYDLYLVEANFETADIKQRMADKKEQGEFVYERRVLEQHLSKENADDWIYKNIRSNGVYVYLHGHVDREIRKDEQNE